jgi:predicted nucleic acid-binding protein
VIVLDTSVVIDLFIDGDAADATDAIIRHGDGALSAITVFELLSGVRNPAHLSERRELIDTCHVLEVSREVSFRAAELYTRLRNAGQLIPNEDLLIAATALVRRSALHTLNRRHYERVPSLRLHEWSAG